MKSKSAKWVPVALSACLLVGLTSQAQAEQARANSSVSSEGVRLFISDRTTKKYAQKQSDQALVASTPTGTFLINSYYPQREVKAAKRSVFRAPAQRSYYTCDQYSPATLQSKASAYEPVIQQAARAYGVNPNLVKAVITAETCFRPTAVSPKGAKGLMQLMPATARRFGVTHRGDVWQNIHGGTLYLRWLLNRYGGSVPHAVAAYNSGEGTVDRYGVGVPYRETQNYTRQVLNAYKKLGSPTSYAYYQQQLQQRRAALQAQAAARQSQVGRVYGGSQTLSCRMAPRRWYQTADVQNSRNIRAFFYTASQGETIHNVAWQTGVTVGQLREYNRLGSDALRDGMRIKVAQCSL